jgi:hypothetical protein
MTHLETLIAEYLEWLGYFVRRNTKVGRLTHGGWEMELDVVGYHPESGRVVHYEPSIDALSWPKREARYQKKFAAGRKYISSIFPGLIASTALLQIAVLITHPKNRHKIAGGDIVSIDEMMAEIRAKVLARGIMSDNAIPEQYSLLRTLQLSHSGYYRTIQLEPTRDLDRSAKRVEMGDMNPTKKPNQVRRKRIED